MQRIVSDLFLCIVVPFLMSHPLPVVVCNMTFNRSTFADIGWFIAATIISWLFASVAFGYYHQLRTIGTRVGRSTNIGMHNLPQSTYEPPNYPPHGAAPPNTGYGMAPPYQGPYDGSTASFGAEKAPGYEYSLSGADGKHPTDKNGGMFDEEDVGYDMGSSHPIGAGASHNPFRK